MRYLFILTYFFISTASAEWVRLGERTHIDPSTIKKNASTIRMWDLIDFGKTITSQSSGIKYKSVTQYIEYDCNNEKWRMLSYNWHSGVMANGEVVANGRGDGLWDYVNPNSTVKLKLDYVCAN